LIANSIITSTLSLELSSLHSSSSYASNGFLKRQPIRNKKMRRKFELKEQAKMPKETGDEAKLKKAIIAY
jgi:hypothetical protein